MDKENKRKFPLWIHPKTLKLVIQAYPKDNCDSQSEFIEKAVLFYLSYLASEDGLTALVPILTSIVQSAVTACEERLARNISSWPWNRLRPPTCWL